jgi:hypothetical protein
VKPLAAMTVGREPLVHVDVLIAEVQSQTWQVERRWLARVPPVCGKLRSGDEAVAFVAFCERVIEEIRL